MLWIAYMKDGSIIRQYDKGDNTKVTDLDKSKVERFRISENSGDFVLNFNVNSGYLKFNNLDYSKLQELSGGEEFKFVYDKDTESFKLDKESFEFIQNLILKSEEDYFYMEFDKNGIINISGRPFVMGFRTSEGEDIKFYNNPPYDNFSCNVDAYKDFRVKGGIPVKTTGGVTAYKVTLEKDYKYKDATINVKYELVYDVMKGYVYLDIKLKANKSLKGSLYTIFDGKRTANPFEFYKGSVSSFNRILTLI